MAELTSIEEFFDWADTKASEGIVRLCPVRVGKGDQSKWTVWGDTEYPHSEPR